MTQAPHAQPRPAAPSASTGKSPPPPPHRVAHEAPALRRFSADEYMRLAEQGLFENQRVELLDGIITLMSPRGSRHVVVTHLTQERLRAAFADIGWCASQSTFQATENARPEPDLCVYPGTPQTFLANPDTRPLLIAEVSHTTIATDRREKRRLYAQAEVPEYWILNLHTDQLEVHRSPHQDPTDGWTYRQLDTLTADQSVTPLGAPDQNIPVGELFA